VTESSGATPTEGARPADSIDPLAGIDIVVFDKDGTLVDFDAMWVPWARRVAAGLEAATSLTLAADFYDMIGFDDATATTIPGGGLSGAPMSLLREQTVALLRGRGVDDGTIERALALAWYAPDPVVEARPLADLPALFEALRARGHRIAVATSDDRYPTEATLAALGIGGFVEGLVCADDARGVKPEPELLHSLAVEIGSQPSRMAFVGDTPRDLRMARAAGVGRSIGVLSGVASREQLEPLADLILASVADLVTANRNPNEADPQGS
jgi:phosphoglycolate phosphatase-like HAD superfamily hydrolase